MKRLLILILICGVFFAGYYVGHLPGSPDLAPTAGACYAKTAEAYQRAADWLKTEAEKMSPSVGERVASAAQEGSSSPQQDADNQ